MAGRDPPSGRRSDAGRGLGRPLGNSIGRSSRSYPVSPLPFGRNILWQFGLREVLRRRLPACAGVGRPPAAARRVARVDRSRSGNSGVPSSSVCSRRPRSLPTILPMFGSCARHCSTLWLRWNWKSFTTEAAGGVSPTTTPTGLAPWWSSCCGPPRPGSTKGGSRRASATAPARRATAQPGFPAAEEVYQVTQFYHPHDRAAAARTLGAVGCR